MNHNSQQIKCCFYANKKTFHMSILTINFLNMDQGLNYFKLILLKKTSEVTNQSQKFPHKKVKKRKKGAWTKLEVKIGVKIEVKNVNSYSGGV